MGIATIQKNKIFLGLVAFVFVVVIFIEKQPRPLIELTELADQEIYLRSLDRRKIEEWWALRNSTKNLSKLGEILFLDSPMPKIEDSGRTYRILVWKYGPTIENRHLKHFSGKRIDPFEGCSVRNCNITYRDSDLKTADIVIFHLHRIKGKADMPRKRDPKQIWAFLTDESPYHTFLNSKVSLNDFNGVFNWSMSYRMDSDIPVPYGRTTLKKSNSEYARIHRFSNKRRDVLVAILGSNCGGQNHRWKYVKELQKYIKVHVYGACGTLKKQCPGHFSADCLAINNYLFYLSFENSNCDEYVTEKLWWNAYQKESIPIVMGSSVLTYKKLLPVDSYINVDDFANPQTLAQYLLRLNETGEFKNFFRWKNDFQILNEHGYFGSKSYHYCRICQALNYNVKNPKVYDNLEEYWSVKGNCYPPWDT